jgi:hypothetical protein
MASVNPQVNFNLKFSDSFWIKLACGILRHSWRDQFVMGQPLPDGRRIMLPEPVCNRSEKFKNFPIYWKDYMENPSTFVRLAY